MRSRRASSARAAGFTLIEVMVALSIFGMLGYTLLSALELSFGSRDAVESSVAENRTLRSVSADLTNEFRLTRDDAIEIVELEDGNHRVTMLLPILVEGELSWGVPGSYLPQVHAEDAKDWCLRYTVQSTFENGEIERRLVRQVLDEDREVRAEEIVAEDLRSGGGTSPGFRVEKTGDVWDITLSMTGSVGRKAELHVATRN